MHRWLSLFLVGALVLCAVVDAGGLGATPAAGSAAAVVGGISWVCPALGILTGLSLATGNWIGAASLGVSAVLSGCVF
jgi:hypothetical protein